MDPSGDLAAALRPIRAPIATEAEALADGLLAFGLSLGAALILCAGLRLFLARRTSARTRLRKALEASRGLARDERLLAQARLAAEAPGAADVRAALAGALYRPGVAVDLEATDAALAQSLAPRSRARALGALSWARALGARFRAAGAR